MPLELLIEQCIGGKQAIQLAIVEAIDVRIDPAIDTHSTISVYISVLINMNNNEPIDVRVDPRSKINAWIRMQINSLLSEAY